MELQIVALATKQKQALQRVERYESAVPGTADGTMSRKKLFLRRRRPNSEFLFFRVSEC